MYVNTPAHTSQLVQDSLLEQSIENIKATKKQTNKQAFTTLYHIVDTGDRLILLYVTFPLLVFLYSESPCWSLL